MTAQSQPRSTGLGRITACAGFVLALLFAGSRDAHALPVFARKYHTSCMTCHEMFPRLNAFGEAFRLHGFRWPDGEDGDKEEEMRKEPPIPMGAEGYKKEFPDSIWPVDPIGFLLDFGI